MKRMIAALALAFGLSLMVPAAAQASTYRQDCTPEGSSCMEVGFQRDGDGAGFTIYYITIWCKPFFYGIGPLLGWEDVALDGHILSIRNLDTNVIRWSRNDGDSNVHLDSGGTDQCKRTWSVNEHYGSANSMAIYYDYTEQLNNQPDNERARRIVINN